MKIFFLIIYNSIIFFLFRFLRKNKKKFSLCRETFDYKMKSCLEKMRDVYGVIEINKLSFGIYHDLANVLTSLNLSINKAEGGIEKEKLLEMSKRAVFLSSFLKNNQAKKRDVCRFSLAEEISNILVVFKYYFTKYNIKIDFKIKEDVVVNLDRLKFNQVVINIVSNAIDALREKDFCRSIFFSLSFDKDFACIVIKDNGPGIPEENIFRVFDPLFSLKQKESHCGLGLYLVKTIVEKDFSGKIKVKSQLNRGAKFIIKIPV
jgi:signal transduction histidine kinase